MKYDAIVVLSFGLSKFNTFPIFTEESMAKAYSLFRHRRAPFLIISDFFSSNFDYEADKMKSYLNFIEIPNKNILKGDKGILNLAKVLEKKKCKHILIIIPDFKEKEIRKIAKKTLNNYDVYFSIVISNINERYKRYSLNKLSLAIREGKINKQHKIFQRYSLKEIYKKKNLLYQKFGFTDFKKQKVDFWSGRFITFFAIDIHKKIYILKFPLFKKDRKMFRREISLMEDLKKEDFLPKIIDKEMDKELIWLLYALVPGKPAGKFSKELSFSKFCFNDNFIDDCIANMRKMRESKKIVKTRHYKMDSKKYSNKLSNLISEAEKVGKKQLPKKLYQAENFLQKNIKIFDKDKVVFSHNDLHPGNLIINNHKVFFIDFEHACLNNIAFDFCFFYVLLWLKPRLQQRFYNKFWESLEEKDRREFEFIFLYSYLYFLVWLFFFTVLWKQSIKPVVYKKARQYVFDEITRILDNKKQP